MPIGRCIRCIHSSAADEQGQNSKRIRALRSTTPVHQAYTDHTPLACYPCIASPLVTRDMAVLLQCPKGTPTVHIEVSCTPFEKRAPCQSARGFSFVAFAILTITWQNAKSASGDARHGTEPRQNRVVQGACEEQRSITTVITWRNAKSASSDARRTAGDPDGDHTIVEG